MFSVYHVISQNHVIIWWFDFITHKVNSSYVTILPIFLVIDIVVVFLTTSPKTTWPKSWVCVQAPHGKSSACQIWWPWTLWQWIYDVISQDHVIKMSYDCMGRSSSRLSYHPATFGGHRHCGNENIIILVCHVILQDHVIEGSCDFMGTRSSR